MFVVVDGKPAGLIGVADPIKETTPDAVKQLHVDWWNARISRQQEINKSIAAKAECEFLFDKPYDDKKKVRVAGPFTVESLSPFDFNAKPVIVDPQPPRETIVVKAVSPDRDHLEIRFPRVAG